MASEHHSQSVSGSRPSGRAELSLLPDPEMPPSGPQAPGPAAVAGQPGEVAQPAGVSQLRLVEDRRFADTPSPAPVPPAAPDDPVAAGAYGEGADTRTPGLVREMACRHGLETRGFDTHPVDSDTVREIIAAVDMLFAKYTVALYGIEIAEQREDTLRRVRRKTAEPEDGAPPRVWITLAWTELANAGGVAVQGRKRFRRSEATARPVYAAVVRAFGAALDEAGGHRARQEAWRILMAGSLGGGGLDLGPGLLDPARALIDGFVEVELRGKRAGETAGRLHEALVKMIRAKPEETSA
ncbi:hypothetical protein [Nocardia sp. NPDC024068]|uniref:hypothetical protein n=1 Tax=Nocardia sp. NPDC024068 TaxID=3157197 RepID=UPI0033E93F27